MVGSMCCGETEGNEERIGLVLGGGARGGVLKVLEHEHVPICAIAGSSVGAIIGSLFAVGYSPHQIEAIVDSINSKDLLSNDSPRIGMTMRRRRFTARAAISWLWFG